MWCGCPANFPSSENKRKEDNNIPPSRRSSRPIHNIRFYGRTLRVNNCCAFNRDFLNSILLYFRQTNVTQKPSAKSNLLLFLRKRSRNMTYVIKQHSWQQSNVGFLLLFMIIPPRFNHQIVQKTALQNKRRFIVGDKAIWALTVFIFCSFQFFRFLEVGFLPADRFPLNTLSSSHKLPSAPRLPEY